MSKQLCSIINPKDDKQYYSFCDNGVLELREVGQRDPLIEYGAIKELLVYQDYDEVTTFEENERRNIFRK